MQRMRRMRLAPAVLVATVVVLLWGAGCDARGGAPGSVPDAPDEDPAIRAVVSAYLTCIAYPEPPPFDPESIATDVLAVWSGGQIQDGREAFQRGLDEGIEEVATFFKSLTVEPTIGTVHRSGDVAWLRCDVAMKGVLKKMDAPFRRATRSTLVLEKRAGRWQVVCEHTTRLAD